MQERGLAGMIVLALDRYSPAMYYVAGQRIHYGVYFRTPDGRAYLVHDPMERDQAEAVGCDHAAFEQHGMSRIQDEEIAPARVLGRSEERRVGKECRWRWARYTAKKNE